MIKWVMNYVIGKFLSDYLEIDTSKTQSGLTSGKFILEQIKIKRDVFKNLNLPFFDIKNSYIGKISIEFTKIMTTHPEEYPIFVEINDIFVNISQKGIKDWSEDKKLEELQSAKTTLLDKLDEYYSSYLENLNQEEQNSSEFMKKLLNNLYFTVTNVVLRVEDDISNPDSPYCIALIMKQLKIIPNEVKKNQTQIKIHEDIKEYLLINKQILMDDFSFYMDIKHGKSENDFVEYRTKNGMNEAKKLDLYFANDRDSYRFYAYCYSEILDHMKRVNSHDFLLYKLDFNINLIFNQDYRINNLPQIVVDFKIQNINLAFDLHQIKTLLKLSSYISITKNSYYYEMQESYFEKIMPPEKAKNYIQYYIQHFDTKFLQKKTEEECKILRDNMKKFEEKYTYEYIQQVRYLAYGKLNYLAKLRSFQQKIKENTPGYVSSFFSSEESLAKLEKFKLAEKELLKTQSEVEEGLWELVKNVNNQERIKKEIEEKQGLALQEEKKYLDNSYIKIKFMLKINNFKLNLLTKIDKIMYYKSNFDERYNKENFDTFKILDRNNYNLEKQITGKINSFQPNNYFYKDKNKEKDQYFENNQTENNTENKKTDENINQKSKEQRKENDLDRDDDSKKYDFEASKKSLLEIKFKEFEFFMNMGLEKMDLFIFLGALKVCQHISNHLAFKNIVESKLENEEEDFYKGQNLMYLNSKKNIIDENCLEIIERKYDERKGALFLSFQMDPELPNSTMRVRIRNSKRIYIYLNLFSLKIVGFLLNEVLNSEIDLETISKETSKQSYEKIKKGYNKIKNQVFIGDYKPFSIHADIILKGPKLIFPQDILNKDNNSCLLLSMGEFSFQSQLANRITDKGIDVSTLKYYNNLFDNYDLNLNGFEICLIFNYNDYTDNINNSFEALSENTSYDPNNKKTNKNYMQSMSIIEKLDLNIMISQLIEPKNIYYEKFKIGIKIEQLTINVNEPIIEFLGNILYYYNYFCVFYQNEIDEIKQDKTFIILAGKQSKKEENENKLKKNDNISLAASGFGEKNPPKNEINIEENKDITSKGNEDKNKKEDLDKPFMELNLIFCKMNVNLYKKISEDEKNILQNFNIPLEHTIVKPFLKISLLDYKLNFVMKENFTFNLIMITNDFLIYDNEYLWIKKDNLIRKLSIIKEDFQFILSSGIEDNNHKKSDQEIFMSKGFRSLKMKKKSCMFEEKLKYYSENKKSLENEETKNNNLFFINFIMDSVKNQKNCMIQLNQVLLLPNISTLLRSKLYMSTISDIFFRNSGREVMIKRKSIDINLNLKKYKSVSNIEIIKERVRANEIKRLKTMRIDEENQNQVKNTNFLQRLKLIMKKRKEKDIFRKTSQILIVEEMRRIFEEEALDKNFNKINQSDSINENKEFPNKNIFRDTVISLINFSFNFRGFDLNIPCNAESDSTEILYLRFNFNLNLIKKHKYENFYELKQENLNLIDELKLDFSDQNKLMERSKIDKNFSTYFDLVAENHLKKKIDLFFLLKDFSSNIEHYRGMFMENMAKEKLISNLRLSGSVKQFLLKEKKSNITKIDLKFEPIIVNLGITYLKVLSKLNEYYRSQSLQIEETQKNEVNKNKLENKTEEKLQNNDKNIDKNKTEEKNQNENEKKDENPVKEVISNIKEFNEKYDININLEKFKLELYDDMGKYECSLLSFDLSHIKFQMCKNTRSDYAQRFEKILLENFINKHFSDLEKENLCYYLDINFFIELKVFQEKFFSWEPLLEPAELRINQYQITKKSRSNSQILCNQILNLNISTNFIFILDKMFKKFKQNLNERHEDKDLIEINYRNKKEKLRKKFNDEQKLKEFLDKNNPISDKRGDKNSIILKNLKKHDVFENLIKNYDNQIKEKEKLKESRKGRVLKIKNETGINLGVILANQKEGGKIYFQVDNGEKKQIHSSEIADTYFDLNSNGYNKFEENNKIHLYINQIDFFIENVDISENKVYIFRIDSKNRCKPQFSLENIENFIQNTENLNDQKEFYAEILVRTKFMKTMKIIILESNVSFYNNTNQSIRLAFIPQNELKENGREFSSSIIPSLLKRQLILDCKKKDHTKVPIDLIIGNHSIFIGLLFKHITKGLNKPKEITEINEKEVDLNFISNNLNLTKEVEDFKKSNDHKPSIKLFSRFEKGRKDKNENQKENNESNIKNLFQKETTTVFNSKNSGFNYEYEYEEVYRFYCKSLDFIYLLGVEYKNMQLISLTAELRKKKIDEFVQKYSSVIDFDSNFDKKTKNNLIKRVIICSDILILKSDDDITYAGESIDLKDKDELNEAFFKSYNFTIIFNPPVKVVNKTPKNFIFNFFEGKQFSISDYYSIENKNVYPILESGVPLNKNNNLGMSTEIIENDKKENTQYSIKMLENINFYFFDMFSKKVDLIIEIKNDKNLNKIEYKSNKFSFSMPDNKKLMVNFKKINRFQIEGQNPDSFTRMNSINLIIETEENIIERTYKPNFYSEELYLTKSRRVNLYFEFIIVNRLDDIVFYPLTRKKNIAKENERKETKSIEKKKTISKSKKSMDFEKNKELKNPEGQVDIDGVIIYEDSSDTLEIQANHIGVFSLLELEIFGKISLKNVNQYNFSNKFSLNEDSINTLCNFDSNNKQFNFNCLVKKINEFNLSKVICLEPKYLISNQTNYKFSISEIFIEEENEKLINKTKNQINYKSLILGILNSKQEMTLNLFDESFEENLKQKVNIKNSPSETEEANRINFHNKNKTKFIQLKILDFVPEKIDSNKKELNNKIDTTDELVNDEVSSDISSFSAIINIDEEQDFNIHILIKNEFFESKIFSNSQFKEENDTEDSFLNKKINKFNDKFYYVVLRVYITRREYGVKYIIISEPKFPDFYIYNTIQYDLELRQRNTSEIFKIEKESKKIYTLSKIHNLKDEDIYNIEVKIPGKNIDWTPFCLKNILDLYNLEKKIFDDDKKNKVSNNESVNKEKEEDKFNIEIEKSKTITRKKELNEENKRKILEREKSENEEIYLYIDTINNNETRIIKIQQGKQKKINERKNNQEMEKKKIPSSKMKLKLKGIGISLINLTSQEIFHLSIYKINLLYTNYYLKKFEFLNSNVNLKFKIYNIQFDYCRDPLLSKKKRDKAYHNRFIQIFVPKEQYIPDNEEEKKRQNYFYFFFLYIEKDEYNNLITNIITSKISKFKIFIGDFDLRLDQNILNSFLEIIIDFTNEIDFYKNDSKQDSENPNSEMAKMDKENKKNDLKRNFFKKLMEKNKELSEPEENHRKNLEEHVKLSSEIGEKVLLEIDNSPIYYIENFKISKFFFNITTKMDISSIKLDMLPKGITNMIGYIANTVTNLNNLEIDFSDVVMEDIYDRMSNVIYAITANYNNEFWNHLGTIISSTKLIGNIFAKRNKISSNYQKLLKDDDDYKKISTKRSVKLMDLLQEDIKLKRIIKPSKISYPCFFRPPRNYFEKIALQNYNLDEAKINLMLIKFIRAKLIHDISNQIVYRKNLIVKIRETEVNMTFIITQNMIIFIREAEKILLSLPFESIVNIKYDSEKCLIVFETTVELFINDNHSNNIRGEIINEEIFEDRKNVYIYSRFFKNLFEIYYIISKMLKE